MRWRVDASLPTSMTTDHSMQPAFALWLSSPHSITRRRHLARPMCPIAAAFDGEPVVVRGTPLIGPPSASPFPVADSSNFFGPSTSKTETCPLLFKNGGNGCFPKHFLPTCWRFDDKTLAITLSFPGRTLRCWARQLEFWIS